MLTYHLIPERDGQDLKIILKKISDYFNSFVGDIAVSFKSDSEIEINYSNTSYTATCKSRGDFCELIVHTDDSITINLLKNISGNSGFRIFNKKGYFLPNDPKLTEVSSTGIKKQIYTIFKKNNLTPLFQYQGSLIFFCLNKKEEVLLINRHYLEFLENSNIEKVDIKELGAKVSNNLTEFIALFDRGLVSLVFPKYKNNDTKVINLSGFDISDLNKNFILQVVNFRLDKDKQKFIQESTTDKITDKNYIAMKVSQDYWYQEINRKLQKTLNISLFFD